MTGPPPDRWREPARDLPVLARPDVLVVGAGSAGVSAALAAARRGADTWLVEKLGFVGGLATFGLINLLLTLDDGEGHQVVAGQCQEFVDRLSALGAARFPDRSEWGSEDPDRVENWRRWGLVWGRPPENVRYSVAFEPEAFVNVSHELLREAGVHIRLHTSCTATYGSEDRVETVVVESKSGREVLAPTVVIDTTGDGDVFHYAGAAYDLTRVYPFQWFRMGGVVDTSSDRPGRGWFRTTDPGRVLVPWGGPGAVDFRIDPTDAEDLTRAELECRRGVMAEVSGLRDREPGFADAWLDDIAKLLGITESRRLTGDYILAKEDVDRVFDDAVARTGHWTRRGVVFDIPYRCLTTPRVTNLLTAGRCISTSRYVHQATKEIPAAMATGEAAGAAAVAALGTGGMVHGVDVAGLRDDLRRRGAIVDGAADPD